MHQSNFVPKQAVTKYEQWLQKNVAAILTLLLFQLSCIYTDVEHNRWRRLNDRKIHHIICKKIHYKSGLILYPSLLEYNPNLETSSFRFPAAFIKRGYFNSH